MLVAHPTAGFTAPLVCTRVPVELMILVAAMVPFEAPWPLDAWPDVPTRFLLCRDDRFFPAEFPRRVVRERLGIEPDEMDGGHPPALSRPHELAQRLLHYSAEVERAPQ